MKRLALALLAPLLLASTNPATETEHVVEEGETLGGIANRAGVPAAVIAAANGLAEPYSVQKGQKLVIPRQRSHVVKAGETGFAIGMEYGVPFEQIAIANGLEPPYTVRPGQRLIIPAVLKSAPPAPKPRETPYFRWPHDGKVILGFAKRPDGGGHDGIDFAVKPGDMVRASSSGTVIRVDEKHPRFGRLVVLDHGHGWLTAYGHLARVTVKKGDVVKTGERIGIAVAPELHFEILKDDKEMNPVERLPKRKTR
ncbi:MAG: M23 family metallopeptidase [Sphingomonadaceae bacterium]|nr:M23 family metallopeptidase [Sphingomonadaceae bacterium]